MITGFKVYKPLNSGTMFAIRNDLIDCEKPKFVYCEGYVDSQKDHKQKSSTFLIKEVHSKRANALKKVFLKNESVLVDFLFRDKGLYRSVLWAKSKISVR